MARTAVRANGRSQPRGTQRPSNTQSQSQRARRRIEQEEEEEEAEEEENAGAGDEDEDEGEGEERNRGVDDFTRKVNALVRLALFNESRHVPLRRDEINKKVLGENTRIFNSVFAKAQKNLQSTFGLELVELMSRAERDRELNENDEVLEDANATGLKKKVTSTGSKTYILRSTLADEIIKIAAEADAELLDLEMGETGDDDEDDPTTYGSIINWTSADQLAGLGLLYVILSLILVNGHSMSDPELKKHLKTFRLPMSATIEFMPHSTHRTMSIEAYLASLVKQGQLDKVRVGPGGAPRPTQGKRGRGGDADEEGATYEWRWGARAHAEVGERAVAEFVAEFVAERIIREVSKDGDEEGGQRMSDKEREKVLNAMMKEVSRATGGKLTDVR